MATKPQPKNLLYPGRPNYRGKKKGIFFALHHFNPMFEYSHDVFERIDYVKREKPAHEIPIRLWNMMYIGDARIKGMADLDKAWAALDKAGAALDKAWAALDKAGAAYDKAGAAYDKAWAALDKAGAAIDPAAVLAYVRKHMPDCAWVEDKGLDFTRKVP